MKLGMIRSAGGQPVLARILDLRGSLTVLDVAKAAAAGIPLGFAPTMNALIAEEGRGLEAIEKLTERACAEGSEDWFLSEAAAQWCLPLEVRHCFAAGRNFQKHAGEGKTYLEKHGLGSNVQTALPSAFMKLSTCMVPHRRAIQKPPEVAEFDYEVEAVAVIGRAARDIQAEEALSSVFGYTVLNDLSAREWQRREMQNHMILLGKNFPGFGPLGPWIVTADEIPDPAVLRLALRVNGETRQEAGCDDMIHSFPELVSHWSRIGLEIGDLVTGGTPGGVAVARQPDPTPFFLRSGDTIEASIDRIGTLQTRVV